MDKNEASFSDASAGSGKTFTLVKVFKDYFSLRIWISIVFWPLRLPTKRFMK
jgi:hypothetical protein